MEKWRIFTAITLPGEIVSGLDSLEASFRRKLEAAFNSGSVKWINPQNIHLTLKFYGSVEMRFVKLLGEMLDSVCSRSPRFELSVAGVGAFPDGRRPRVIWAGLNGDINLLRRLQQNVEDGSKRLGFKREDREFRPHLTIARVKSGRLDLSELIKEYEHWECGKFMAEEVVLFRSVLKPEGAEYLVLSRHGLSG
jgi:2'-5' RNA ligase